MLWFADNMFLCPHFFQIHNSADLLCFLFGADDDAEATTGEEDRLWAGQVRPLQKHLCCSLLLPHPHCAAGSGGRTAV